MADSRRAPRCPLHRHDHYPGRPSSCDTTLCYRQKCRRVFRSRPNHTPMKHQKSSLWALRTLSSTCATLAEDREEFDVLRHVLLVRGESSCLVACDGVGTTTLHVPLPCPKEARQTPSDGAARLVFISAIVLSAHCDPVEYEFTGANRVITVVGGLVCRTRHGQLPAKATIATLNRVVVDKIKYGAMDATACAARAPPVVKKKKTYGAMHATAHIPRGPLWRHPHSPVQWTSPHTHLEVAERIAFAFAITVITFDDRDDGVLPGTCCTAAMSSLFLSCPPSCRNTAL